MNIRSIWMVCCLPALLAASASAADYSVQKATAPPPEEVSAEQAALLTDEVIRVQAGTRTAMEIWFAKSWRVADDFKPTLEVLYPFKPGQLLGVVRYARRGADFRDQTLSRGVYVMRYAQQPVDGNHVGTSPTRDFVLLTLAESDTEVVLDDPMKLMGLSAEAAQSSHPAMLCLQRRDGKAAGGLSMLHDEERDWWLLRAVGQSSGGPLPVDMVVSGYSE